MISMKSANVLVEGGKASAAPPLGPMLGPLGVNIVKVVEEINKKTEMFKGMKIPVKIVVDEKTKEFSIEVGSPPISALIKKELKIEKLATSVIKEGGEKKELKGQPAPIVGNLSIDQVVKIAKSKDTLAGNLKSRVKQVVGTCLSCGVTVENQNPKEIIRQINEGKFDNKINL